MTETPIWTPSTAQRERARVTAFARALSLRVGRPIPDYATLHAISVNDPAEFWSAVWDECGVIGHRGVDPVVLDADRMPGARFFPGARLNFAENAVRGPAEAPAIVARREDGLERRVTRGELRADVGRWAAALRDAGVQAGDRVGAIVPNSADTIAAALGVASIGAVWSSCSPDFGVRGVLDRFGQIAPRVLISVDGYHYGGKRHGLLDKLADIVAGLPGLARTFVVPYLDPSPQVDVIPGAVSWPEVRASLRDGPLAFERFPFDHPLYILYSSGTTGIPKCIVHGAGGTLVQHLKEHQLHCDIGAGDRVFYFTTCGWMMWNWLVTVLASEATILLYDGSPFHPDGRVLFDFAEAERMTLLGTSAKYLGAVEKAGLSPAATHHLEALRTITSTGSVLPPESFDFVYTHIKPDVHLASISGGTDIVGCFVGGNPAGPVWRGEIQAPGLGMDVAVFDEAGRAVRGEKGELVCRRPFPSMPLGFWNDEDGRKYHAAYFERFPGVWCHGDYAELTEHGGLVIHGRSDAVLNPGGVRIGTAEIYRQVEQLPEVLESLVVGQRWHGDERIVLFVRLRDDIGLDATMMAKIRDQIRRNTTPRHVPALILAVPDIPRTKSGKIVELAVRDIIHGRPVKNREALANPEALELFRDRPELES